MLGTVGAGAATAATCTFGEVFTLGAATPACVAGGLATAGAAVATAGAIGDLVDEVDNDPANQQVPGTAQVTGASCNAVSGTGSCTVTAIFSKPNTAISYVFVDILFYGSAAVPGHNAGAGGYYGASGNSSVLIIPGNQYTACATVARIYLTAVWQDGTSTPAPEYPTTQAVKPGCV